jgi:hypothetical protein
VVFVTRTIADYSGRLGQRYDYSSMNLEEVLIMISNVEPRLNPLLLEELQSRGRMPGD